MTSYILGATIVRSET